MFLCQLPPLKAMENPDEFEIDDEGPDVVTEEEYQKSRKLKYLLCGQGRLVGQCQGAAAPPQYRLNIV